MAMVAGRAKVAFVAGFMALLFASVASTQPSWKDRRGKKMVNVAMPSLPKSLDSTELMLATHFILLQCTCQTLVRINESGALVADAVSSWEFGSDGKTVTFRLKPELTFSDGSRATAQDVADSFRRHLVRNSKSAVGGYLRKVLNPDQGLTVPGDNIIKFSLLHPYAPFLHVLAMPGFCVQKPGPKGLIGTGPLKVTESSNSFLKLVRNLHYTGAVNLDELEIRALPKLVESFSAVDLSNIDLAIGVGADAAARFSAENFRTVGLDSLAIAHLYFNVESRADLKRPQRTRIRKLLSGLPREFQSPYFEPLEHFLPRGVLPESYYSSKANLNASSSGKAKFDAPLRIKLLATIFSEPFARRLGEILRNEAIESRIERLAPNDFLAVIRTGDYDLLGSSYTLNFPDADSVLDTLDTASALRLGRFPSQTFMSKVSAARSTGDNKLRLSLYTDALLEFESESYIVPMFKLRIPVVHRDNLVLPSASFRYEAELWKVLWKNL